MRKDRKTESRVARFVDPVLRALKELGGSGRPAEVKNWLLKNIKLDQSYLAELNQSGELKFSNHVDWARFYLVRAGYLDSSKRGVWSLTELGRSTMIDDHLATKIVRDVSSAA